MGLGPLRRLLQLEASRGEVGRRVEREGQQVRKFPQDLYFEVNNVDFIFSVNWFKPQCCL